MDEEQRKPVSTGLYQPRPHDQTSTLLISVIIPTLNEATSLPRLLQSIRSQREADVELIVVDQDSDDGTADIAHEFGCTVLTVPRASFYSPPALSRNAGATAARGSVLMHLDADMACPPGLFATLTRVFNEGHRAAILHEADVAGSFWTRVKAMERRCYWNTPLESARAFSRELFEEVGGYDVRISSGEDFDISRRHAALAPIYRHDDLVLIHHLGRASISRLIYKKFCYGRTADAYLRKVSDTPAKAGIALARSCLWAYVCSWRLFFGAPVHYVAVLPLRILEFVAVLLGGVYERLKRQAWHR